MIRIFKEEIMNLRNSNDKQRTDDCHRHENAQHNGKGIGRGNCIGNGIVTSRIFGCLLTNRSGSVQKIVALHHRDCDRDSFF